jgi:Cohesin domain
MIFALLKRKEYNVLNKIVLLDFVLHIFEHKPICPMTMLRTVLFFIVSSLLVNTSLFAQNIKNDSAYIFLPDVKVQKGNIINLPIKISTFDSCVSTQFAMRWDSTHLEFQGVSDFGYPKVTLAEHFNLTNTASGRLVFVWYDNSLKGLPAKTDKIIFNAKFKVIGNDVVTEVKFADPPTSPMEVSSTTDNKVLKIATKTGKVTIGNPAVSIFDAALGETKIEDFYPNPMYENTRLNFQIAEPTSLNIDFFDIYGKNIFHINDFYNIGTHFVELGKNQFPNAGAFVYKVSNNEGVLQTGKLIVIK